MGTDLIISYSLGLCACMQYDYHDKDWGLQGSSQNSQATCHEEEPEWQQYLQPVLCSGHEHQLWNSLNHQPVQRLDHRLMKECAPNMHDHSHNKYTTPPPRSCGDTSLL